MFRKINIILIGIIVFIVVASSCNNYKKLMKSNDYEKKYEKGMMYYEKKDHARAQPIFEELRTLFRGTEKGEKVALYYANCTFELGEYTLAAYLYRDFARQFPASKDKEKATFRVAYCYYLLSPELTLDQSDTETAVSELQYFLDKYPNSELRKDAEKYIDELRKKLETKAYRNAMLYHTIGDYKAAIVALKNVMLDFPDTQYREEILFTIVKSSYLLATNSIQSKQKERYKNTIDAYHIFIDNYPNSKKIKEAENFYNNSLKGIEKNGI